MHAECQDLTDDLLKVIVDIGGLCWNCDCCLASSARLERAVNNFDIKLKEMEAASARNAVEIRRVDDSVGQLRKEFEAEKVKNKNTAQQKDDRFLTREEYREREARRCNVVMHRIREAGDELRTGEDRKRHDFDQCKKIFSTLGMEEDRDEVKVCRRIGERGQEPRPMVVVLKTEETKRKLLEAARSLKDTEYEDVGIVPDMTVQQRNEEKQMMVEVDRLNEEELTEEDIAKNLKWIVVGPRGAKRIIKGVPRDLPLRGGTRLNRGRSTTRGSWRGSRGSAAATGANATSVGRGMARAIEPRLEPDQLLPSTENRTRLGSKRKEREEGMEEEEGEAAEGMEEDSRSPLRKK